LSAQRRAPLLSEQRLLCHRQKLPHLSRVSRTLAGIATADITAGAAPLFARNPDWQFVFDTDRPQAVETRKKLYEMAAAEKMMVQAFHIAFPSMVYVEKNGNGYRLVPVPWSSTI